MKYSRDLPSRLQETFIEALSDPNRLALDSEIALLQTRISELLQGLDVAASADAWEYARQLKNEMMAAIRRQDSATQRLKLQELSEVLDKGHSDAQSWEQIGRFTERLRKVKETEIKRVTLAQETITKAQFMAMLVQVAGIIRENVGDPLVITRISNEFARLMGPTTGTAPDTGDSN